MLRTTDEMRRTGRTGWADRVGGRADGWADGRTSGRGLQADEWTGGRTGGWADKRTGPGTLGGRADGGGQWADGRTGGRRISEGKTPNLTCQLTWPWEIQRGHPRVTVKLPHLPPPSR